MADPIETLLAWADANSESAGDDEMIARARAALTTERRARQDALSLLGDYEHADDDTPVWQARRILATAAALAGHREGVQMHALSFEALRAANVERQREWCGDASGVPDLAFRALELAGEAGELANVVKKLERERLGWRGSRTTVEALEEELGDVVICADLVAISAGVDLGDVVARKFNATSSKVGLTTTLPAAPPTACSEHFPAACTCPPVDDDADPTKWQPGDRIAPDEDHERWIDLERVTHDSLDGQDASGGDAHIAVEDAEAYGWVRIRRAGEASS